MLKAELKVVSEFKSTLLAEILKILLETLFMLRKNLFIFLFCHEVYNVSSELALTMTIVLL